MASYNFGNLVDSRIDKDSSGSNLQAQAHTDTDTMNRSGIVLYIQSD